MKKAVRVIATTLTLMLLVATFGGCNKANAKPLYGTAENDIITFTNNIENKPIVRIGTQHYITDTYLVDVLGERFPDYLFVMEQSASAGTDSYNFALNYFDSGQTYDLIYTRRIKGAYMNDGYLVDLSTEPFLNHYLLSSLNDVSQDGHIYAIPGTSIVGGIAYNMDMFQSHGWKVPTSQDEFFALCAEIKAAGITPFASCFKYPVQAFQLLAQMSYSELFSAPADVDWLYALQENKATYKGHMEPMFELAKRFADTGVITLDYFSASLTKQRQAFWAGEYAMLECDSSIFQYAKTENAPFAVSMAPYPTKNGADAHFPISPNYHLAIPKAVEKDPERLALMKEVLAFLSTEEGQLAVMHGDFQVSNIKGIKTDFADMNIDYIAKALETGHVTSPVNFDATEIPIINLQYAALQTLFEGATVEQAIAHADEDIQKAFAEGVKEPVYENLAVSEKNFTTLETSYYIADKLKEATDADIGLMVNGGYFCSNLAMFFKGDITSNLSPFVMKGVTNEDYLTTYRMTGAQIRTLLEHPIINGSEVDALIAASGLKITYAPWNQRGSRVIELTLADGSPLKDDTLYTVAAWNGAVAEQYRGEPLKVYDALGSITDILQKALKADGTIKPEIQNRVTLVWPAASK